MSKAVRYRYEPEFSEWLCRRVVAGRPIRYGSAVALIGDIGDAMRRFVLVQDEGGNQQVTNRSALVLIRTQEAFHA